MSFHERLRQALALLESQRGALGDDVVELAAAPLHERLARETGETPGRQLRQVSVLFCDVVGSTGLIQHLTPEQSHTVMDQALAAFTRLVHAGGGVVLQYAGDSLLAAWGTQGVREGDAAAAVRAGLAILQEGAEQSAAVRRRHGHEGFGVRAGVATGPVLLGSGVEGEHSIRGMTVYLAARLEQTAPPGRLRVCPDTWRMVRGLFDGEAQPPLQVKGRDEPVLTWLVAETRQRAPAQAERGIEGLVTPCVGREPELARLEEALAAPGLRGVLVIADPGLGKTRLVREFLGQLAAHPGGVTVLSAQGGERTSARPYGLLRQLLGALAGLRDSDTVEAARQRWLDAQAPLLRSQGDAAVLGQLLGLDFGEHPEVQSLGGDARQLRDRAFFHASQLLQAVATRGAPLVLWLDDLHGADAGSLDFVDHLLQHQSELQALMLATARPELEDHAPGLQRHPAMRVLALPPLAEADAAALGRLLLAGVTDDEAGLLPPLLQASAGNPFYLEELVQMLRDHGAIARLEALPLPRTLNGVLQSRLDRLPPEAARLLQGAAIVGPVFWDDALAALGLDTTPLDELVERRLIVMQGRSRLEGRSEYAFRHQLMHRVCYERVVQADRVAGHVRVARWLERWPGGAPPEQLADHHERGEEPALAVAAWRRAALQAQARYANAEALAHAGRALALARPDETALRFTLTRLRAQVLALIGDTAGREAELAALDALAATLGDDTRRAEALDARAKFLYETGDAQGALQVAERAALQAPPTALLLRASSGRHAAHALQRLGRHREAADRSRQVLELARRAGDRGIEGAMLNLLGLMADETGDLSTAIGHYEEALACHRASGNQSHEADVLSNLGYVALGLGAYEEAASRFDEVLSRVRRIGQREREATALLNLALVALHTRQPGKALTLADAAESVLGSLRSRWLAATARRIAGQACLAAGLPDGAVSRLQQAVADFTGLEAESLATEARASLASAWLAKGRTDLAHSEVERVLSSLDQDPSLLGAEEPLRAYAECVHVLHTLGDARAATCRSAGRTMLEARAERISDATRRDAFLNRVPHHGALRCEPGTDQLLVSLGSSSA